MTSPLRKLVRAHRRCKTVGNPIRATPPNAQRMCLDLAWPDAARSERMTRSSGVVRWRTNVFTAFAQPAGDSVRAIVGRCVEGSDGARH
jgi:hypothetical protein